MSLGVCCVLAQAILVKPAIALLGEYGAMLMGLLCGAMGMAVFGTATTGALFLLGIPLIAAWGIASAAGQSLMTRKVSASEQGQLQGALSSLSSIAALVGPIPFALTYAWSINKGGSLHMPGEVWLLSTLMLLVAAVMLPRISSSILYESCLID
jgi:DHA1 family tetracycline resistance protein-like MFS transporter